MKVTLSTLKYSSLFLGSLFLILSSALFFPVIFAFISCSSQQGIVSKGSWSGVAQYANRKEIPFRLEMDGKSNAIGKFYLLNGTHQIESGKISQKGDSLFVDFGQRNRRLKLKIEGKRLSGVLTGALHGENEQTASLVRK